jgi:hypothetical protein
MIGRWAFCGGTNFSFNHDRRSTSYFKICSSSQKVNRFLGGDILSFVRGACHHNFPWNESPGSLDLGVNADLWIGFANWLTICSLAAILSVNAIFR